MKISNAQMKELRRKAHALRPTIQIGKRDATPEIVQEIKKQLKTHKLLKIKLLKSMETEKNAIIKFIERTTGAITISKTGSTLTIYKGRIL